jgi:hypothetical protein
MRANGKIRIAGGLTPYTIESVSVRYRGGSRTKFVETTVSADLRLLRGRVRPRGDFLRPVDMQRFSDEVPIDLIGRTEFRRRYPANSSDRNGLGRLDHRLRAERQHDARFAGCGSTPAVDGAADSVHLHHAYLAVSSAGVAQRTFRRTTDEPIVPLRYRHAIVFHALYHWYRDKKDDVRSDAAKGEYTDIMLRIMSDVEVGANRRRSRSRLCAAHGAEAAAGATTCERRAMTAGLPRFYFIQVKSNGTALAQEGLATATTYAVLCGGTTATGAFQSIASVGTLGQVLTSNGASALPTFGSAVTLGTEQATTSGTSIDFTGIPRWAKKITISLVGVSTNGTSNLQVQTRRFRRSRDQRLQGCAGGHDGSGVADGSVFCWLHHCH